MQCVLQGSSTSPPHQINRSPITTLHPDQDPTPPPAPNENGPLQVQAQEPLMPVYGLNSNGLRSLYTILHKQPVPGSLLNRVEIAVSILNQHVILRKRVLDFHLHSANTSRKLTGYLKKLMRQRQFKLGISIDNSIIDRDLGGIRINASDSFRLPTCMLMQQIDLVPNLCPPLGQTPNMVLYLGAPDVVELRSCIRQQDSNLVLVVHLKNPKALLLIAELIRKFYI
jgi:hypothetical protein